MIEEMMLPFRYHFEGGFYATAEAFKTAAEKLGEDNDRSAKFFNGHMPVNYLYRHSIELYLKSMIVTLVRALKLPLDGGKSSDDPANVLLGPKKRPLTKTHSLQLLLNELDKLLKDNEAALEARDAENWDIPPELRECIAIIEAHDEASMFSRYPFSKSQFDDAKAGFLKVDVEKLSKR